MDALPGVLLAVLLFLHRRRLAGSAAKTIRIVPQATVMLVERLGRFDKIASSGLNILVPFLDRRGRSTGPTCARDRLSIDLREQYLDLPPQPVITRDNVTIHVDSRPSTGSHGSRQGRL